MEVRAEGESRFSDGWSQNTGDTPLPVAIPSSKGQVDLGILLSRYWGRETRF